VKKRFLADYQLISEAGRVEHLLSDGRAKEILSRLQSSARSALPERIGPLEGNRTSLSVANPALKAIAR
jgi:hypothetical protein